MTALAHEIFAADSSLTVPGGSLIDVDSTSIPDEVETTWDIDVQSYVTEENVARYVGVFTGRARDQFSAWLQRGKRFEPIIRSKFRAAGIPEDMYFLGLVESGFDAHAYSRAAAVGMWQFMSSTARGVGLRVDWWVDERRDPMRATDAAARFLGDLRDQFGSLYLAAAAYNGGPGRVSRGLRKYDEKMGDVSGEDRFFALAEEDYLRSETKNYVPQLIAAALIGKDPGRYGIRLDSVAVFAYDSVLVPERTPLAAVARAARVGLADVQELNPHFLRGVTPPGPPGESSVRIPVGTSAGFDSLFRSLPDEVRIGFTRLTSEKGETLASIGARHGVSAQQMGWYNRDVKLGKGGRIPAGTSLLVPSEAVVAAALNVPDPGIERYSTGGSSSSGGRTVHVVRRGESLGLIAKRYRTSVASLVRLNRLRKQVIYPGQAIIVRGAAKASATKASSKATSRSSRVKRSSSVRKGVASSASKSRVAKSASARKAKSASKPKSTSKSRVTSKSTSKKRTSATGK